ncbi:MAG TPA: hypothetical protein VGN46_06390 [Luteibacter sp.]|jgi:hypothetical protein|uniref:hypothetical protein n=1 Tax=Luteibacter sp. TaxID=1886636 RepID=UPI002F42E044
MSQPTTLLVDTDLERDDAAAAANALYLKLVGDGTISPLPGMAEDAPFEVLDRRLTADTGITAIGLHASGHRWRLEGQAAEMVDGGRENGIFCRYDGSFTIRCPQCLAPLSPGDEGSDALEEALIVWCDSPDSAFVACPNCSTWTPLTTWQSPRHDFAVGHFAISLHGVHLHAFTDHRNHAAMALRQRLGDLASDYTVVYSST